jgi:hypothetical protein
MRGTEMKKFLTVFVVIVALAGMSGCAALTKDVNTVDGWITGTGVPDVCAAATYYTQYIEGVVSAVALVPVVGNAVGPIITLVNSAIGTLNTMCQSGALASTIQAQLNTIDGYIQQINSIVGQAKASGVMK